jgi:Zn-dependent protease with chaperone function/tetratricopeptide (TPR) repeat protein
MKTSAAAAVAEKSGQEVPLKRSARIALMGGCAGVILLCYIFSLLTMTALLVVLAIETALMLALLRFGMAGLMLDRMRRHFPLLRIFVRSLFLRTGESWHISLTKADAPRLFALIEEVSTRMGVPFPREVCLEMGAGAWVQLRGWRAGSKDTVLGLGYDLLAVLDEAELAAVLAHEMAHAKLVKRGLKQWLNRGLGRSIALTRGFGAEVERYRRVEKKLWLGEQLLSGAHRLSLWGVRMVSAYSRQDEFDADRGAAAMFGSASLRSSLMRLEQLTPRLNRLPWNERVSQLQGGESSFSKWLVAEFSVTKSRTEPSVSFEQTDEYSTHPSLHDRIAALPASSRFSEPGNGDSKPALWMLADPDVTASRLVTEIQRLQAAQEERDSRELDKWARRSRTGAEIRLLQWPGVFMFLGAALLVVVALVVFFADRSIHGIWALLAAAASASLGAWLYRIGGYRDKRKLPVPDYALIIEAWRQEQEPEVIRARQKELEERLGKMADTEFKKSSRLRKLLEESHAALARCDFLHAFTASRLALEIDGKHVDSALAFAVASGALGLGDSLGNALEFLHKRTAFSSPSIQWGAGWALTLSGDWERGEAFLRQASARHPDHPTFAAMIALAQWRRGKMRLAIANARKASAAAPGDVEVTQLLVSILIDAGHLRDAGELLVTLPDDKNTPPEFLLKRVRLALLQRQSGDAEKWTLALKAHEKGSRFLVGLGDAYETAREDDRAAELYREALQSGHYPEALSGLARIEFRRDKKDASRDFLLQALEVERPLAKNAASCFGIFGQLLEQLAMFEEPQRNVTAWTAKFDGCGLPDGIRGHTLMVYGVDRADAELRVKILLDAMYPAKDFFKPSNVTLRAATADQQPAGLVRPGVQYAIN